MRALVAWVALLSSGLVGAEEISFDSALTFARGQVQMRPNDAKSRFSLARVLLVGYALEPEKIDVTLDSASGLVVFPERESVQVRRKEGPISAAAKDYLKEACLNFNRATRYDANTPLYSLANAWAFEQLAWHWSEVMGTESFGEFGSEADAWAKVSAEYRRAWSAAKDKDKEIRVSEGANNDALVSREAAKNMLRLKGAGKARVTDAEAARFQKTVDDLGG